MKQLLALALIFLCAPAQAGPWLQAEGESFLAVSTEVPTSGGQLGSVFATAYLEHGVRHDVTLGFDLGGTDSEIYKAVIFGKIPLKWFDGDVKAAVEFGVGLTDDDAVLRPGLSLGRGFPLGEVSGWMSLDTLAHIKAEDGDVDLTTDLTFGINMTDTSKLIFQIQSGHQLMDLDYAKFAPSYVFERRTGQHIELGMLAGLDNAEDFAVKLGIWQKF